MTGAGAVRRLVTAARRLVLARAAWIEPLARSSGLSREGVELALTRHLEIEPTDAEIDALVARAGRADVVHVILSANVFTAALRALALARAAAPRVVVRPSRRDPLFARALVAEAADPAIALVDEIDLPDIDHGEIHVYGRDETIAAVRAASRVRVRGHGAGLGVAVVGAGDDLATAARAVAEDVVVFDQRGCLSPRLVFAEGDLGRAEAFARALHEELARAIPRGALAPEEAAEARRYEDALAFAGLALRGAAHLVGVGPLGVLPPPGRHVHVAAVGGALELGVALSPLARWIAAVGTNDPARWAAALPPHARVSPLGSMQRPPFDGPVDLRDDAR